MCIVESIVYSCGHSPGQVLRLCPMTTVLHTNPVCKTTAQLATRTDFLCPTCARINHGKYVDIVVFQHRWMHERGVCGCAVQFPDLQQPRIIGKAAGTTEKTAPATTTTKAGGGGGGGAKQQRRQQKRQQRQHEQHEQKLKISRHALGHPGAADLTPIMEVIEERGGEATTNTEDGDHHFEKTVVTVRQASQHGAEWITDHAPLHRAGRCDCPVSFAKYQPHDEQHLLPRDDDDDGDLNSDGDKNNNNTASSSTPIHAIYPKSAVRPSDVLVWRTNEQTPEGRPKIHVPHQPATFGFVDAADAEAFLLGITETDPDASSAAAAADATSSSKDLDAVEALTVQHEDKPMVGWPIGAGPEGGLENSHSPGWETCILSRPKLTRSQSWPGDLGASTKWCGARE